MKKRIIIAVLSFFLSLFVVSPAFASGFTASNVTYNSVTHVLNFDYSGYDFSTIPDGTPVYLRDQTIGDNPVGQSNFYYSSQCTATHCTIGMASGYSYQDTDIMYIRFLTDSGNLDSNDFSLTPIEVPPVTTTTLSPTPYSDGTYPDPTTVTLSASAASGYSVANTYYTIDGGTQQTYSSPFTVTGGSSHTITYWSVDNEGVQESPNTKSFIIYEMTSEAAPVTTATLSPTPFSDGIYNDPTTVTLSATAASGYSVTNTYYTIDGGSQQTYSSPITVRGAGSHTITYWSVDNEGKLESANTKSFTLGSFTVSNVTYDSRTHVLNFDYSDFYLSTVPDGTYVYIEDRTIGNDPISQSNFYYSSQCTTSHCTIDMAPGYTYQDTDTMYLQFVDVPSRNGLLDSNDFSLTPATTPTPTPVAAINAGGDTQGNFSSDTDYNGGSTFTTSANIDTSGVTNPAPDAVYQSVRYGNFSYTITNLTANGTYTLQLHFSEPYWGTSQAGGGGVGSRIFNVSVNGTQELSNFDVYQAAGGANKAVVEQIPATADSNGDITVTFSNVVDNAMVSGIAVYNGTLPSLTPSPTPTPVPSLAISAGGPGAGDYVADTDYTGGTTYNTSATIDTTGVTDPAPQSVYQNVRYGNTFSYTIPTDNPNTNYTVRLDFSEPYWQEAGKREFNVSINGTQVLNNFDVYQTAGGQNKAVAETFNTTSDSNGLIHIQFTSDVDNAMVSGIQISQQ